MKKTIGVDMETAVFDGTTTGRYNYGWVLGTHNDGFEHLSAVVRRRFDSFLSQGYTFYTTDASPDVLWALYLEGFPFHVRQFYNCHECERFIRNFGGLVIITKEGKHLSALFNVLESPTTFEKPVRAMQNYIEQSQINGIFVPESTKLGVARTGVWTHFAVSVPKEKVHRDRIKTAYQVMAEKKEDFKMLMRALNSYTEAQVDIALGLLRSESLFRGEKVLGVAEWFREVQAGYYALVKKYGNTKVARNKLWQDVNFAPVGFTHIRSSMIGTLLEDIAAGLPYETVASNFREKMNPNKYQRPQAAPKLGNIKRGEEIIDKLGLQPSLVRRFARLDELQLAWKPRAKQPQRTTGVFSHIAPKAVEKSENKMHVSGTKNITWEKFARTVLPYAEQMEVYIPSGKHNFSAIVTAEYSYAPPILQWDSEERRNPFNWYVYHSGSYASNWSLSTGWNKVSGVAYQPSMWYEENAHQGKSVFLLIEGAKDTNFKGAGNALFPEVLRPELREIRATIEAHSKSEMLRGIGQASASGIKLESRKSWNWEVRVTTNTGVQVYKLDRWD